MNKQGLTLIEVLVALALIAIVFAVLATSQIGNIRITRDSQQTSVAMQLANRTLETASQTVLENWSTYATCNGEGSLCSRTTVNGPYAVTYRIVQPGSAYAFKGLIQVSVSVSGPVELQISQYLSCMDVNPPPTITNPGMCG